MNNIEKLEKQVLTMDNEIDNDYDEYEEEDEIKKAKDKYNHFIENFLCLEGMYI